MNFAEVRLYCIFAMCAMMRCSDKKFSLSDPKLSTAEQKLKKSLLMCDVQAVDQKPTVIRQAFFRDFFDPGRYLHFSERFNGNH